MIVVVEIDIGQAGRPGMNLQPAGRDHKGPVEERLSIERCKRDGIANFVVREEAHLQRFA